MKFYKRVLEKPGTSRQSNEQFGDKCDVDVNETVEDNELSP